MSEHAVIGAGTMGQYTAQAIAPKVNKTFFYDPVLLKDVEARERLEDRFDSIPHTVFRSAHEAVEHADLVTFCVPTHLVYEVMAQVLPYCKKGTIITDQSSRKTPAANAFAEFAEKYSGHDLHYASVHSMCNPEKADHRKEILALIYNGDDYAFERIKEYFGDLSDHIELFESVEEHDTRTANTQINTSRTLLSIASAFATAGCFPWLDKSYGSGFDAMKFALAMRAASQPAHVYRGIQFGSEHGRKIIAPALEVESELFRMIVSDKRDEYRERVLNAKRVLFGGLDLEPILNSDVMGQFINAGTVKPNSHFSIVQYAVAQAEGGRNPFADIKATTPLFTSLLCLMDFIFLNVDLLEESIAAPFEIPSLRSDDLVFHDQIHGWSNDLLFENELGYDTRHARMIENLDESTLEQEVEKSRQVVRVCREAMNEAIKQGRIQEILRAK